jgi:hypothetical protein
VEGAGAARSPPKRALFCLVPFGHVAPQNKYWLIDNEHNCPIWWAISSADLSSRSAPQQDRCFRSKHADPPPDLSRRLCKQLIETTVLYYWPAKSSSTCTNGAILANATVVFRLNVTREMACFQARTLFQHANTVRRVEKCCDAGTPRTLGRNCDATLMMRPILRSNVHVRELLMNEILLASTYTNWK